MFLAFFPFSEAIYVVAIILAWVYIACGLIGKFQAEKNISSYNNNNQVHEKVFQVIENIKQTDRTFYWKYKKTFQSHISKKPFFEVSLNYIEKKYFVKQEFFESLCHISEVPNRAPPLI